MIPKEILTIIMDYALGYKFNRNNVKMKMHNALQRRLYDATKLYGMLGLYGTECATLDFTALSTITYLFPSTDDT